MPSAMVGVALFIIAKLGYLAMAIYTPALALGAVTGLPIELYIVVIGMLTAALTLIGGMEGVIWQDVVQYFVIVGGILGVVFFFCFSSGDTVSITGGLRGAGKTRMLDFL